MVKAQIWQEDFKLVDKIWLRTTHLVNQNGVAFSGEKGEKITKCGFIVVATFFECFSPQLLHCLF